MKAITAAIGRRESATESRSPSRSSTLEERAIAGDRVAWDALVRRHNHRVVVSLIASAIDRDHQPVLIAPSMNEVMLRQPATRRNLDQLAADGFTIVEPAEGWQACRTEGAGRLPEPETLLEAVRTALAPPPEN